MSGDEAKMERISTRYAEEFLCRGTIPTTSPFVAMLAKLIKQAISDFVAADASPKDPRDGQ